MAKSLIEPKSTNAQFKNDKIQEKKSTHKKLIWKSKENNQKKPNLNEKINKNS